jgi:uncharacterized protein
MRRATVSLILILLLAGCGGSGGDGGTADNGDAGSETASSADSGLSKPATSGPCKGVPVELCDIVAPESTSGTASETPILVLDPGGSNVQVRIEIADDMNEMERGLMDRTALAENAGMLFVYPQERELSFWMRNTLIPLSIAFMDSEGRIVDIQDMEALDDQPPHYTSAEPAQYALEVNQGFFDERGVEVGDRAKLPA